MSVNKQIINNSLIMYSLTNKINKLKLKSWNKYASLLNFFIKKMKKNNQKSNIYLLYIFRAKKNAIKQESQR
jgi:hypothetical protein